MAGIDELHGPALIGDLLITALQNWDRPVLYIGDPVVAGLRMFTGRS